MTPQTAMLIPFAGNQAPIHELPPLILHPFADATAPHKLVESSRASLVLQGLLPSGDRTAEDLDRALLEGRYSELRMLFYVGKDVIRWIDQCLEYAGRTTELANPAIRFQSFASLLLQDPPVEVQEKLKRWGVTDYKAIFARGIALNCLFTDVPPRTMLADDFVLNYHRYADQLFQAKLSQSMFTSLNSREFQFDLYSSAEYARMLERSWEE
jgi:hypothetical protein